MELSDLAFRFILILFPGIIATLLYRRLITKEKWEAIDIGLNSLFFGILAYINLQLIYNLFNLGELIIWKRLQDNEIIPYFEVIWASIVSVFSTFIISAIVNYRLINKLARFIKVSNKYGEDNLFYNFLSIDAIQEVHIIDPQLNLIYTGYLKYYSEDANIREIVLEDVDLFEYESAKHKASCNFIYISKSKSEDFIIEIPKKIKDGETKKD